MNDDDGFAEAREAMNKFVKKYMAYLIRYVQKDHCYVKLFDSPQDIIKFSEHKHIGVKEKTIQFIQKLEQLSIEFICSTGTVALPIDKGLCQMIKLQQEFIDKLTNDIATVKKMCKTVGAFCYAYKVAANSWNADLVVFMKGDSAKLKKSSVAPEHLIRNMETPEELHRYLGFVVHGLMQQLGLPLQEIIDAIILRMGLGGTKPRTKPCPMLLAAIEKYERMMISNNICIHCQHRAKKICSKCGVAYCCTECQKLDWTKHKTDCIIVANLRKAYQNQCVVINK